mgnify:CR=1 FL=1
MTLIGKLKNQEKMMNKGVKLPAVNFQTRVRDESIGGDNPYRWQTVNSEFLFGSADIKKRVVVFSLPGAFTPTCSTYQLPDFEKLMDEGEFADVVDPVDDGGHPEPFGPDEVVGVEVLLLPVEVGKVPDVLLVEDAAQRVLDLVLQQEVQHLFVLQRSQHLHLDGYLGVHDALVQDVAAVHDLQVVL